MLLKLPRRGLRLFWLQRGVSDASFNAILASFSAGGSRQKLMLRLMEAMGVNVPEAMRVDGGLPFLEAQGKCRYCESDDSCRQWCLIRLRRHSSADASRSCEWKGDWRHRS